MTPTKNVWYRLGYALEQTRTGGSAAGRSLRTLAERTSERKAAKPSRRSGGADWPSADELMAAGVTAAVAKVLDGWRPRRKAGIGGLLRAGLAGAAAALVVDLLRPLILADPEAGQVDQDTPDRMLAGAGQGLIYGAIVEPRVPGPSLLKGALYGSAEYAVHPMGGLSNLLGSAAPQRKLPVVGGLFEASEKRHLTYLEHVAFGVALAVLYRSSASSNGIRIERDDS